MSRRSRGMAGMSEISRKLRMILLIVGILLFIGALVVYPYSLGWSVVMILAGGVLVLTGINSVKSTLQMRSARTMVENMRISADSPRVYQDKPVNPWDTVSTDKPVAPASEREYTSAKSSSVERQLEKLKAQYEAGLCSKEEYQARRKELLKKP